MAYTKAIAHEVLLIFQYAIFPTILSLLLTSLNWNYDSLMSVIKVFVFLRVVHNEDFQTGRMYLRFVIVKLLVGLLLYFGCGMIAFIFEQRYLPPGITSRQSVNMTRVRIPKSRVASLVKDSSNAFERAKLIVFRILVEYLHFCRIIAQFRWSFLALFFVVFGTIHAIMWAFLPDKGKSNEEGSEDEDE